MTTYNDVKTASALSADIETIDLASQVGRGTGGPYSITFASGGITVTGRADISAINLKGADALTINGEGGADKYRGRHGRLRERVRHDLQE
jgi:hypothetical protein